MRQVCKYYTYFCKTHRFVRKTKFYSHNLYVIQFYEKVIYNIMKSSLNFFWISRSIK